MPASKKVTRKDVSLTSASRSAARSCLEAGYIVGMGTESTLALCAGLRLSCALEEPDASLYEDDLMRIVYRAAGLTIQMTGQQAVTAALLIDELERAAITEDGPDLVWDTLAAAVGDAEPADADPRMVSIFRALRGRDAIREAETRKGKRPSTSEKTAAIARERDEAKRVRETRPLPAYSVPATPVIVEARHPEETADARQVQPGKIACRLLSIMHGGFALVDRDDLPGSGSSVSRLLPAMPTFDRSADARYVLGYEEVHDLRHYDREYGWELEHAGWIVDARGTGDHVYCLTREGLAAAVRMFGPPSTHVTAIDIQARQEMGELARRFATGEIDEAAFAAQAGVAVSVLPTLFDQISWYGADDDVGDLLESPGLEKAASPPPT